MDPGPPLPPTEGEVPSRVGTGEPGQTPPRPSGHSPGGSGSRAPAPPLLRPSAGGGGVERAEREGGGGGWPRAAHGSAPRSSASACAPGPAVQPAVSTHQAGRTPRGSRREPPPRRAGRVPLAGRRLAEPPGAGGQSRGGPRGDSGTSFWELDSPPCPQPVPRGEQGRGTGNDFPRLSDVAVPAARRLLAGVARASLDSPRRGQAGRPSCGVPTRRRVCGPQRVGLAEPGLAG